ncbi:unnamed protein product, partial [Phaeothamnion confervicola]
QQLQERKIHNTTTSICLGFAPKYSHETDAQARQKDILSAPPHASELERNRRLKLALTRTNFSLDDGVTTTASWQRVSTMPDPTGHMSEYTGVLNEDVKNMIKKSNLFFGTTPTNYTSTAAKSKVNVVVDESPAVSCKPGPGKINIAFGDEPPDYLTDYKRGFQYDSVAVKAGGQSALAREVKDDLRRTHFSLGNSPSVWETDARISQRTVLEHYGAGPAELAEQRQRNAALKKQLQSTNIQIGFDEDYM